MIHRLIAFLPEPVANRLKGMVGRSALFEKAFNVVKRFASRWNGTIASGPGKGLKFNCSNGRLGYLSGQTQEEEQALLSSLLEKGDVFYDIGANIGFFSVIAAHYVGRSGHVYAFEPIPKSAQVASKNAQINAFDQITVMEVAVSSRNGQVQMNTENGHSETYSVVEGEGLKVQCATLDRIVAAKDLCLPDFVKIDVEGHEIEALRGALQVLEAAKPLLLVEVHWMGRQFISFCRETLEPLGYNVTQLDGSPLTEEPVRYHALAKPVS